MRYEYVESTCLGILYFTMIVVVVVVLTLTHRHNTMQSVVAGQAPITLEWKNTSEKIKI